MDNKESKDVSIVRRSNKERKPLTQKAKIVIIMASVLLVALLAVGTYFICILSSSPYNNDANDLSFSFYEENHEYDKNVDELVKIFREDCGIQLLDPRGEIFSFGELTLYGEIVIEDYKDKNQISSPIGFNYSMKTKKYSVIFGAVEYDVRQMVFDAPSQYQNVEFNAEVMFLITNEKINDSIIIYEDTEITISSVFVKNENCVRAIVEVFNKEKGLSFCLESTMLVDALLIGKPYTDLITEEVFLPIFNVLEEIMAFYVKDAYDINIYA